MTITNHFPLASKPHKSPLGVISHPVHVLSKSPINASKCDRWIFFSYPCSSISASRQILFHMLYSSDCLPLLPARPADPFDVSTRNTEDSGENDINFYLKILTFVEVLCVRPFFLPLLQ